MPKRYCRYHSSPPLLRLTNRQLKRCGGNQRMEATSQTALKATVFRCCSIGRQPTIPRFGKHAFKYRQRLPKLNRRDFTDRSCDSGQGPSRPSIKCCCVYDATLPEKSVPPTNSIGSTLVVAVDSLSLNFGTQVMKATYFDPLPSGPPLQILLCAWCC